MLTLRNTTCTFLLSLIPVGAARSGAMSYTMMLLSAMIVVLTWLVFRALTPVRLDTVLAAEADLWSQLPCKTTEIRLNLPDITVGRRRLHVDLRTLHFESITRPDSASLLRRKEPMILLHGSSSSSVAYLSVIASLVDDFDLYAVDLPGFGISSVSPGSEFCELSPPMLVNFYIEVLRRCVSDLNLGKLHLVGHSLGAYLSTQFAYSHPQCIETLVVVDPAGLLPTLGDLGFYWAIFFKLGLPTTLFRALGRVPARMYSLLCRNRDKEMVRDHLRRRFSGPLMPRPRCQGILASVLVMCQLAL